MQRVVGQIPQYGDLRHGFHGDFRSVGADTDALVFVNVVVEFSGQVQPVEAGLVLDRNTCSAPGGKGSGGIHRDNVVTLTAVQEDAGGGKGLAVQLAGNKVNRGLQEVLREGEVTAAADAQSVLAVAAVHGDVGRAHIHSKAELVKSIAFRIGIAEKGHDHIAGVNELDAAHVLAVAKAHIHAHSGEAALRAANTLYEEVLQGVNIRKNIMEADVGIDEGRQLTEGVDLRLRYLH